MPTMKRARTLLVAAFAGSGVLIAHSLAYLATSRSLDPHQQQLLSATGHDYYLYLAAFVTAVSVFLLSRYTSRRLSERTTPGVSGVQLFAQAGVRLIPLQTIAFIVLELTERTFLAGGVTNVFGEPAVQLGLLFQVVVALIGALLLAVFAGAIEAIRRHSRIASARRKIARIYPTVSTSRPNRLALAESGTGLRSPPSSL
jgi:hypothetical protein